MAAYLEPGSLQFLDKEVFTDVTAGDRHEADVVVRARFHGTDSYFLVHVENQAQVQPGFAGRMFRYFARLHERHALPVYPIAVFSHDSPRIEPAEFGLQFPDLNVLQFRFRAIQLRRLRWRDYVRQPNPVAAALMSRMGMEPEERPWVKLECLRLLTTLRLDAARMKLISGFVDTYLRLNRDETLKFERAVDTVLNMTEKSLMRELTTSWKEEGRVEGRVEGRREECLRVVSRQLERRLGSIAPEQVRRLEALPLPALEDLAEALLDFSSPADMTAWLRRLPD
jgi:hypothetical protein